MLSERLPKQLAFPLSCKFDDERSGHRYYVARYVESAFAGCPTLSPEEYGHLPCNVLRLDFFDQRPPEYAGCEEGFVNDGGVVREAIDVSFHVRF